MAAWLASKLETMRVDVGESRKHEQIFRKARKVKNSIVQKHLLAKRRDGEPVTCPFCRSAWPSTTSPAVNEGYLNLAAEAGLDPERDGSSYIYGLSRRRYGYGW